MSDASSGRVPDGTGLSSPTDPSSTVSALAGFDPSRIAALMEKATPLPWHRANLANVTQRIEEGAVSICGVRSDMRVLSYHPLDDTLATIAVNLLPQLLAIAMEAHQGGNEVPSRSDDRAGQSEAEASPQ